MSKSEFVAKMESVASHFNEIQNLLRQGPIEFYLKKLAEHSEALLTKFAPFKVGDQVIVSKEIECKGSWRGCEKTLQIGAVGTVKNIDYYDGEFWIEFMPSIEWWKDRLGEYHASENRHFYSLPSSKLSHVSGGEA